MNNLSFPHPTPASPAIKELYQEVSWHKLLLVFFFFSFSIYFYFFSSVPSVKLEDLATIFEMSFEGNDKVISHSLLFKIF